MIRVDVGDRHQVGGRRPTCLEGVAVGGVFLRDLVHVGRRVVEELVDDRDRESFDLIAVAFVIGPLTLSLNALSLVGILLVGFVMRSWF